MIGKKGANLERVKEMTSVDTIVVDSQSIPATVRIKGPTPDAVSEARRLLEYTQDAIDIRASQVG